MSELNGDEKCPIEVVAEKRRRCFRRTKAKVNETDCEQLLRADVLFDATLLLGHVYSTLRPHQRNEIFAAVRLHDRLLARQQKSYTRTMTIVKTLTAQLRKCRFITRDFQGRGIDFLLLK